MHVFFMLLVKKFLLGHNEFKILVSLRKRSWYAARNAGNRDNHFCVGVSASNQTSCCTQSYIYLVDLPVNKFRIVCFDLEC